MNCLGHGKWSCLWGLQGTMSIREVDLSWRQGGRTPDRGGTGSPGERVGKTLRVWHAETRSLQGTSL